MDVLDDHTQYDSLEGQINSVLGFKHIDKRMLSSLT